MKSDIKGNHEPGNYTPDTTIFTDISLQNYDLPDQITTVYDTTRKKP